LTANRERTKELSLSDLDAFRKRIWDRGVKGRLFGRDEDLIEVLQVIDRCVLRQCDVNAHGYSIHKLIFGFDSRERRHLSCVLDFMTLRLDTIVSWCFAKYLFIRVKIEHRFHESSNRGPHVVHVLGVRVVLELFGL